MGRRNEETDVSHRSRREFMGLTGGAIAAAAFGPVWFSRAVGAVAAAQTGTADLVVVNAKVYTVDSRTPQAQAFAVKAGRFIAVGRTDEMKAFIGKSTQSIDARDNPATGPRQAWNLGMKAGLDGHASLVPLYLWVTATLGGVVFVLTRNDRRP